MKCRICRGKAIINLRSYNLPLCSEHFIERFESETKRIIKKFKMFSRQDKVAVAISGGKDSLSLLYCLNKLRFSVLGIHINLGIYKNNYSDESEKFVKEFGEKFNIPVLIYNLKDKQKKGIDDVVRQKKTFKVCATCGMVKRYLMNRLALENGCNVLATGHNLDDEASRLFGNILYWQEEHIEHQSLVLPEESGLLKKVKPFTFFTEKETSLYAILNGISYIREECPYSIGAKTIKYKEILNRLEFDSPGTKLRFLKGFYSFKKKINITSLRTFKGDKKCIKCGMPSTKEICIFCRTFEEHPFIIEKV